MPEGSDSFFNHYFRYVDIANTEAPMNCHRWCGISIIGALLSRNFYLPFGHSPLYPNTYIQIIGEPATRKSTAIKIAKKLLADFGYNNFAPESTSMEKFLMDLHDITWGSEDSELAQASELEEELFGSVSPKIRAADLTLAEYYIASDEFVDFIGRNNINFISLLGSLWDYNGVFDRKLKHSKAVYINNPTISIIAGNTPDGFNMAFPPDIQGQGFFSRLLLIHAKPTGKKITFPESPSAETTKAMLDYMKLIQQTCVGEAKLTPKARELCDVIYKSWQPINDPKFKHYSGRRFSHLLKLTLICTAMRLSTQIDEQDIVLANTILTFAEHSMPKAMGEFGKGRYSAITHKILEAINKADVPMSMVELIKHVHNDIDNLSAITELCKGLTYADKIQVVDGKFLPKKEVIIYEDTDLVKPSLLLPEELNIN